MTALAKPKLKTYRRPTPPRDIPLPTKRLHDKTMLLAIRAQVLKLYSKGSTVEQIADALGYSPAQVTRHLNAALDSMVRHYAKASPQHTFVRYATFQMDVIKKLQDAYENIVTDKKTRQYNAAISSLRAQSDIFDKIVEKGIDYGIITRKRADKSIRETPHDLQIALRQEITILTRLLDEVDTHDEFKKRRARVTPPGRTHLALVRKVKRNALGWVRAIPDWKYRTKSNISKGNLIVSRAMAIPLEDQQDEGFKLEKLEAEYKRVQEEKSGKNKAKRQMIFPAPTAAVQTAKQIITSS